MNIRYVSWQDLCAWACQCLVHCTLYFNECLCSRLNCRSLELEKTQAISMQSSLFPLHFPPPHFSCTSASICISFLRSTFEIMEGSWDNGQGFDSLQAHLVHKRAKEACHIFLTLPTQDKVGKRALQSSKPMISLTPRWRIETKASKHL